MKGLDTNVLVRYIVQDDPEQSRIAVKVIEETVSAGHRLVIFPIVLCELVWVLESAYGYRKVEIHPVIDQIMRTAQFEIIEKDTLWRVLADYFEGSADFSDYYIGRVNERVGSLTTLTFDKSLNSSRLFTLL